MKKIIIVALLGLLLLAQFALADTVNMNISVNGTANLNVTVTADDTLAREAINETQNDVYGTMTGSGPKDLILNEINRGYGNPINGTNDLSSINEICSDPYLQQWLGKISGLPPKEFVDYMKALGYDDESHITFIWSMCQQMYVNQHEAQWSADNGIKSDGDIANIFKDTINFLITGQQPLYPGSIEIAKTLGNYFANKEDVWGLSKKVKELDIRMEALERTMENVSSEAYCHGKLEVMKEYNLTGVKCGINSTFYWNAKKAGFDNYDTIAYTTCSEDWSCSDWSDCINNAQTRKCADKNNCGNFDDKPIEYRNCTISQQKVNTLSENEIDSLKVNKINKKEVSTKQSFFLSLSLTEWIEAIIAGILISSVIIFLDKRSGSNEQSFSS